MNLPNRPRSGPLGGRPRKFSEPSRPVTVTLPDRTLDLLRAVDGDRALAIAKAVDAVAGGGATNGGAVKLVEVASGLGLLVVPPNQSLRAVPWLRMIEVAPARFILVVDSGTTVEKLELALLDLIDDAREALPHEVPLLEALRAKVAALRRGDKLTTASVLLVSTD